MFEPGFITRFRALPDAAINVPFRLQALLGIGGHLKALNGIDDGAFRPFGRTCGQAVNNATCSVKPGSLINLKLMNLGPIMPLNPRPCTLH